MLRTAAFAVGGRSDDTASEWLVPKEISDGSCRVFGAEPAVSAYWPAMCVSL